MLVDAYGYYDMAMVSNLLPLMKQYNVQARDSPTAHINLAFLISRRPVRGILL